MFFRFKKKRTKELGTSKNALEIFLKAIVVFWKQETKFGVKYKDGQIILSRKGDKHINKSNNNSHKY